ncbi:unnamed protein product [Clavelina lepadiformis]|uniref:Peptidase M20 dimerisation domain-containing protein n=1 Tax=Clavelina lepadiformis TaxID=159417 RepID=A0ABP0FCN9_CLALP
MRKALKFVCALLSLLIALLVVSCIRTFLLTVSRSAAPTPCHRNESQGYITSEDAWPRFKKALQFRTVSNAPHVYNRKDLQEFVTFLLQSYPQVFQSPHVRRDIINEYSLLISVSGKNRSLTPYLLAAHLDVVPVVQEEWTHDGFGAEEEDDGSMVYARGAIDDKSNVIAQLEALSFLISKGIQPQRGFFLAFGHDEEVGGHDGAARIAEELWKRGIHDLDFVLDEGLTVLKDLFQGLPNNIAGIGVTEKGSLHLNLSVHSEGGHSSMPPKQTSIGILSAALAKLEANQHDIIFDEMTHNFVESISLDMPFPLNVVTSNLWLFKPLVARALAKGVSESMVRTTTAVTMFQGGLKPNVIPPTAWAVINHRIHPKQTIAEVSETLK